MADDVIRLADDDHDTYPGDFFLNGAPVDYDLATLCDYFVDYVNTECVDYVDEFADGIVVANFYAGRIFRACAGFITSHGIASARGTAGD